MRPDRNKDIAIIIPARNEAERIGSCLMALAGQLAERVVVVVVINNTTDETNEKARQVASHYDIDIEIMDCVLPPEVGVGTARRIGCSYALRQLPSLRYLLTTDADCIVSPDWVASNIDHLHRVDVVCGKIDLIAEEADILKNMDQVLATNEGRYRTLVQQVYAQHSTSSADMDGTHGEAAGASLAFKKSAYLNVGGFQCIKCGEDREIVRAFRSSGHLVLHADNVIAYASCRLAGRAIGGMSDALKARTSGTDYLIDDCLPDAAWLVTHASRGTLGVWPPQVPAGKRVHIRELPRNIEALEVFMCSERAAITRLILAASTKAELLFPRVARPEDNRIAAFQTDPMAIDDTESGKE